MLNWLVHKIDLATKIGNYYLSHALKCQVRYYNFGLFTFLNLFINPRESIILRVMFTMD